MTIEDLEKKLSSEQNPADSMVDGEGEIKTQQDDISSVNEEIEGKIVDSDAGSDRNYTINTEINKLSSSKSMKRRLLQDQQEVDQHSSSEEEDEDPFTDPKSKGKVSDRKLVLKTPRNFSIKSPFYTSGDKSTSSEKEKREPDKEEEDNEDNEVSHMYEESMEHQDTEYTPEVEEESDMDVSQEVLDDMEDLRLSFKDLHNKYRLINKIGEGTFSTVYKAEAINNSVITKDGSYNSPQPKRKKPNGIIPPSPQKSNRKIYVALKRIYVTSSPQRIYNELNLLYMLQGSKYVAPLLDIVRHQDQVIAVLPYFKHADFRDFYRDIPIDGMKLYMHQLFLALNFVHSKDIIHRDIKPTNFLYDPIAKKGKLVDFGLAEQQSQSQQQQPLCPCNSDYKSGTEAIPARYLGSLAAGYPKEDTRAGRRANRAGTRGFRAPEVLFKCTNQKTKIDIWSVGVILLTLLTRRFPFFNSPDDVDALVELTTIFGTQKMKECAELHGLGLDTTVLTERGYTFGQIVHWTINLERKSETLAPESPALEVLDYLDSNGNVSQKDDTGKSVYDAIDLLHACFHLNPKVRISAEEALQHPFFDELKSDDDVLL